MHNSYPSKLLVFGEYLVLHQGAALSIPDHRFQTSWVQEENPDEEMLEYLKYLRKQEALESSLDFRRLEEDLLAGWKVASDIPRHAGLGSSASVVAAVYDRYKTREDSDYRMEDFHRIFSEMENYMHGVSSGFDPMAVYFRQPVLRKNGQSVLTPQPSIPCLEHWDLELIDSGSPRKNGRWILRFQEKMESDKEFASRIATLTKVNNKMVEAVIKNERRIAENLLTTFSENQFHLFEEWIPDTIKTIWQETNEKPDQVMKILGAGGGGYFLRIHFDPES